jgi:hypothetical protein
MVPLAMQRLIFIFAFVSGLAGFGAEPAASTNKLGLGVFATPQTNTVAQTNAARRPAVYTPPPRPQFVLRDGDRVVFLGDTFMEREQLESYIETMLTLRFRHEQSDFPQHRLERGHSARRVAGRVRSAGEGLRSTQRTYRGREADGGLPEPLHDRVVQWRRMGLPKFEVRHAHAPGKANDSRYRGQRMFATFSSARLCTKNLPPPLARPGDSTTNNIRWYNEAMRKLAVEKQGFLRRVHAREMSNRLRPRAGGSDRSPTMAFI